MPSGGLIKKRRPKQPGHGICDPPIENGSLIACSAFAVPGELIMSQFKPYFLRLLSWFNFENMDGAAVGKKDFERNSFRSSQSFDRFAKFFLGDFIFKIIAPL